MGVLSFKKSKKITIVSKRFSDMYLTINSMFILKKKQPFLHAQKITKTKQLLCLICLNEIA